MLRAFRRFGPAIRPWRFRRAFWQAAERLQVHGTDKTNYQVFLETLGRHSRVDLPALDRIVREFLVHDFPHLSDRFVPIPGSRETLELARRLGYRVVLATNPVWPLDAVHTRLRAGGLDEFTFDFISHSEVMTRCKPDPRYYRELLERLQARGGGVPDDRERSAEGSAGQGFGHRHVPDRHASARPADGRERHARGPARPNHAGEGESSMAIGPQLICVTGPDGAGKTTQIARIADALSKRGKKRSSR